MSTGQANVRTVAFHEQLARLPQHIQEAAEDAFRLFLQDSFHPLLENHQLYDTNRGRHRKDSRAVSITRRYRAIYVIDGPTSVRCWIGSHADYDNFIGTK